jgi:hypothetical protein
MKSSKQASFDYQKFDDPQVSRAALQQGFGLTKQQWRDISTIVNQGLIGHWQLRSRAAKQAIKEVRHGLLGAFPELSILVPPQWVEKGTYQIIRAVRATWREKNTSRRRGSAPRLQKTQSRPLQQSTPCSIQLPLLLHSYSTLNLSHINLRPSLRRSMHQLRRRLPLPLQVLLLS